MKACRTLKTQNWVSSRDRQNRDPLLSEDTEQPINEQLDWKTQSQSFRWTTKFTPLVKILLILVSSQLSLISKYLLYFIIYSLYCNKKQQEIDNIIFIYAIKYQSRDREFRISKQINNFKQLINKSFRNRGNFVNLNI